MKLRWAAEARQQLTEVRAYIEQDNPRAAASAVQAIRSVADRLVAFPESGRFDPQFGVRICAVPRTPYLLYYVLQDGTVTVVSVWHGARLWPHAPG